MSTNVVVIQGNCTNDAEPKTLPSGQTVLEFAVAVNRRWKSKGSDEWQEETSFIDVRYWGARYGITKGCPVLVNGELRQDRWTDKAGQNRSKLYVSAVRVTQFARKPAGDRQPDTTPAAATPDDGGGDDCPF